MKRLNFSLLLSAALLLLVGAKASAESVLTTIDGLTYSLDLSANEATLSACDKSATEANILENVEYSGKTFPVRQIGKLAFEDCAQLATISIPKSINHIGEAAFCRCHAINKVNIADLAQWCNTTFDCDTVWVESNYETCCYVDYDANPLFRSEDFCLNGEKITNLVIPDGVTKINDYGHKPKARCIC